MRGLELVQRIDSASQSRWYEGYTDRFFQVKSYFVVALYISAANAARVALCYELIAIRVLYQRYQQVQR